jgi:hypothetical protein
MKTAFLDTSVISECHRLSITPKVLNEILKAKKLIPIVGIFPNFEIGNIKKEMGSSLNHIIPHKCAHKQPHKLLWL